MFLMVKTAIDNEVRYGEEASKTMLHNFFVDESVELKNQQSD